MRQHGGRRALPWNVLTYLGRENFFRRRRGSLPSTVSRHSRLGESLVRTGNIRVFLGEVRATVGYLLGRAPLRTTARQGTGTDWPERVPRGTEISGKTGRPMTAPVGVAGQSGCPDAEPDGSVQYKIYRFLHHSKPLPYRHIPPPLRGSHSTSSASALSAHTLNRSYSLPPAVEHATPAFAVAIVPFFCCSRTASDQFVLGPSTSTSLPASDLAPPTRRHSS